MALTTEEKSSLLYKHYLGTGSTRLNREFFEEAIKSSFVVQPKDMWTYGDRIPDGTDNSGGIDALNEIKNLGLNGNDDTFYHYISEDKAKVPLVKRWIKHPLTMIDKGTDNAFLILDDNSDLITDIIPFNYYEEYYNYELYTADGTRIPFGVGDWFVDIYSGILTFYGELPDGVNHENPPVLSFYQYVGGNGFRQDTYGYDGAILPLDSVEIPANTCVITNGSEGRTLYQHIVDKANEIADDFADTFGWDGDDRNEGIALSFEKIVPLTYTGNQDAVKGYDKASDSEIGTLLSDKEPIYGNDNYRIVFASQKLKLDETYSIEIKNGEAIGRSSSGAQDAVAISGNDWNLYKVWVTDNAFVVLSVINAVDDIINFSVITENNIVSALLLYWSGEDKQYQPFLTKEDTLGNFGFPVVTVNGRLPPSIQLGTAALATFSDVITPDYYGPRTFAVTVAKEDGTDVKSADYIVKNKQDWYLNDILNQINIKYGANFRGTIFLRAGNYEMSTSLDLSQWHYAIITGEGYTTKIDMQGHDIIVNEKANEILELNHIKLENVGSVQITTSGILFMSDLLMPAVDFSINATKSASVFIKNLSANNVTIDGEQDASLVNVDIRGCHLNDVSIFKNKTYLKGNTINSVSVDIQNAKDNTLILRDNIITTLKSKYSDLFIDGNMIFKYVGIAGTAANQIPVGTSNDYEITNFNKDTLTTTGRFPIYDKNDSLHMKYAEFASPFNYDDVHNSIELLYDPAVFEIKNGVLTTVIKSEAIAMSNISFDRHPNSELTSVAYTNQHSINDVFKHIYMWKADLDESGKIPLQELPDSVAYGGLLYVGNWSFEQNNGLYPSFKNALYQESSKDKDVDTLQKGWFFIVQEAVDTSDEDGDNDNPVAEQEAADGAIFTAGDWVIYVGNGSDDTRNEKNSWQKIDRAYSDPTYSPLPYYAKVPGIENLDWYWKKNRNGGALDLSGSTIIEAFKKVNDELKKLQPKKPSYIGDVGLEWTKEYSTVSYRKVSNNVIGQTYTKLDTTNAVSYNFRTKIGPNESRTYKELIFFGDEATLTVNVDDNQYVFTVKANGNEQQQGPVYVSAPTESMKYADHGEGYWQGFYIEIKNDNLKDGEHYVRASLDDVKVLYDDATDTYQFQNEYAGSTNTITYSLYEPYFPSKIERAKESYIGIAEVTLADKEAVDMCSGIRKINLANIDSIPGFNFILKNIYKDHNVPTGTLAELKVLLNDDPEKVFCAPYAIDDFIEIEDNENSLYQNLTVERVDIPITYENKNDVIPETTTLDFYITVYDLYNQPHEAKIYSYTGVRFDPVEESERVSAGNLSEDSSYKDLSTSFGRTFVSSNTCNKELCKIGEIDDTGNFIGVYQQPIGTYSLWNADKNWTGELIDGAYYGTACFNIGHIEDATGFIFEIQGLKKDIDAYSFNKLTGSTKDILLQFCLVDPTETDNSLAKLTSFMNVNSPYDGFTTVKGQFNEAVMYAGNSNAVRKRVTFGHNRLVTGDVYIRIGIKKGSGLRFLSIKLVEEI